VTLALFGPTNPKAQKRVVHWVGPRILAPFCFKRPTSGKTSTTAALATAIFNRGEQGREEQIGGRSTLHISSTKRFVLREAWQARGLF
jgi:hypothetical protein